jgi:hypothetical protein
VGPTENPKQTDVLGIFQLFIKKCGDLGNGQAIFQLSTNNVTVKAGTKERRKAFRVNTNSRELVHSGKGFGLVLIDQCNSIEIATRAKGNSEVGK